MKSFYRSIAVRALAALLALAAIVQPAALAVTGCASEAANQPYAAVAQPIGDSITYGVAAETLAGWREPLYNLAAATTTTKLYMVGSLSFDGNAHGLAADPFNEGHSNYVIRSGTGFGSLIDATSTYTATAYHANINILAGGTNDLAADHNNDSAATVLASMSTWLDLVWAQRTSARHQIILCEILKRLDADNSKVITVNAGLAALVAGKSYAANIQIAPMYASITRAVIGQGYFDAVHPLNEGYTDMANAMWPYVRTAITRTKGAPSGTSCERRYYRRPRAEPWLRREDERMAA